MLLGEIKTIPTIHNIVYLIDILKAIANDRDSFEEIRRTVAESRRTIESKERVAHSMGEKYLDAKDSDPSYMWNQSAKNLHELMQLGLVKERPLKYSFSSGDKVTAEPARRETYELTEDGWHIARLAESHYDMTIYNVLELMYKAHPKLRAFIDILQKNEVLFFPELTVETIEGVPIQPKEYIEYVCTLAAEQVQKRYGTEFDISEKDVASNLENYVLARMQSTRAPRGSLASFVLKAVNRGTKSLILAKKGLKVDIPSFEVMTNWVKQLRICNFARGLPDMRGLTLYLTAYIKTDGELVVKRRTKEQVLYSVLEDIPKFFYQFKTKGSPWASIYPIRAAVCFKNRIDDEVFDEIIRDIFYKRVSIDYKLALETDLWSAPFRSTKPLTLNGEKKRNIISVYDWKGG
jgi:hypothetical protein